METVRGIPILEIVEHEKTTKKKKKKNKAVFSGTNYP